MNYSTAVMLINENIRAIKVTYEKDQDHNKAQRYIYKTLDQSIEEDDLVVVSTDTRHGFTVVKVVDVDVDVDFENDMEIKWIVSKISTQEADEILVEEEKWIDTLKAAEKRRKREEIKKSMLDMYEDDGIDKLAIASMGGATAIEDNTKD